MLLLPALLMVGCATTPPKDLKRKVHIDSDPQGVRVFYGIGTNEGVAEGRRAFIGVTPFDYSIEGDEEGRFKIDGALVYSIMVQPAAVFIAEPKSTETNLFTKRQVFHAGAMFSPPNKIPEGLFFDLTKK